MIKDIFIDPSLSHLNQTIVKLISASQAFIRKMENNEWCVSLRDVHRCCVLISWFWEMLHKKVKFKRKDYKAPEDEVAFAIRAIVLSLSHCYEVRLQDGKSRQEYWQEMSKILYSGDRHKELKDTIRNEQLDILNRMKMEEGIANNTALRENVFVIFVCIMNHIPIFLVGKPGCSKSLSMQMLRSNLRGLDSEDDYFKTLPQIYVVSYQGSESSTSEGIIKIFEKAQKYKQQEKDNENILPVVLLDEIGLAEISKYNPLKVLHSLLEPNTGFFPEVAVVGISNWALDAAKMNRAIHLSRPDLCKEELFDTGHSISSTYTHEPTLFTDVMSVNPTIDEGILMALSTAYFNYQKSQKFANFHGLRDFYSLVKHVCRQILQTGCSEHISVFRIIQEGLLRNFGGLPSEINAIVETFVQELQYNEKFSVSTEDLIYQNVEDLHARHLMLITSGDSIIGALGGILKKLNREYRVFYGSKFQEDQTEEYSYRMLSNIIHCMDSGIVLILKDLDDIYGSLYDMLNQNYTVVGKKKTCRIALGALSNPMCPVHELFRCIVLVEENCIDYSDPPFLNRFEKQLLHFEELLDKREKMLTHNLRQWIRDFVKVESKSFSEYGESNSFLGFHNGIIPSLVKSLTASIDVATDEEILKRCKSCLLLTCTPDAILRLSCSTLAKRNENIKSLQDDYFQQPINDGISVALENIISGKYSFNSTPQIGMKFIIFTRSSIHTDVRGILQEKHYIQVESLGIFKSERQMTAKLNSFYENKSTSLLIVQCNLATDADHLLLAKLQIENQSNQYFASSENTGALKHICFLVHVDRNNLNTHWQFDYSDEWMIYTVDVLDYTDIVPEGNYLGNCGILKGILNKQPSDLLQSPFQPIGSCVKHNMMWAFSCLKYSSLERHVNKTKELVQHIKEDEDIIECISDTILNDMISNEDGSPELIEEEMNWQVQIASNEQLLSDAGSLIEAWKKQLERQVQTTLAKIVWFIENMGAWDCAVGLKRTSWIKSHFLVNLEQILYMKEIECVTPQGVLSMTVIKPHLILQFPFSRTFLEKLQEVYTTMVKDIDLLEFDSVNDLERQQFEDMILKYFAMVEHRFNDIFEHKDLGVNGYQLLLNDFCNEFSWYKDVDVPEEIRVNICKTFCETRVSRLNDLPFISKVTAYLIVHTLENARLYYILKMLSISRNDVKLKMKELAKITSPCLSESDNSNRLLQNVITVATIQDEDLSIQDSVHNTQHDDKIVVYEGEISQQDVFSPVKEVQQLDYSAGEQDETNVCRTETCISEEDDSIIEEEYNADKYEDAYEHFEEKQYENNVEEENNKLIEYTEEADGQEDYIEDKIVEIATDSLIPVPENVDMFQSIEEWYHKTCAILSYCSKIESQCNNLHLLRFCLDLANCAKNLEIDLKELLNSFMKCVTLQSKLCLDSNDALDFLMVFSKQDVGNSSIMQEKQRILCLYFARCLEYNPSTELVPKMLKITYEVDLPCKNLDLMGPFLKCVMVELSERLESVGANIIYDNFDQVGTMLHELQTVLQNANSNNPFLVMCYDNVLELVSKYVKILHVEEENEIQFFQDAMNVLKMESVCGLQRIVCLVYNKVYLHSLVEKIESTHNDQLCNMLQKIDSTLSAEDLTSQSMLTPIYRYMLYILSCGCIHDLQNKCNDMAVTLPTTRYINWPDHDIVSGIGSNLLSNESDYLDTLNALEVFNDDHSIIKNIFEKQSASKIRGIIAAISEKYYWPKYVRGQLKDTEKDFGKWLENNSPFNNELTRLMLCLSGVCDFKLSIMNISSQHSFTDVLQNAFLLHLISMVFSTVMYDQKQNELNKNVFVLGVLQPKAAELHTVPINYNSPESEILQPKSHMCYICVCKTICIAKSMNIICPVCGSSEFSETKLHHIEGNVMKQPVKVNDLLLMESALESECVVENILMLILEGSFLAGISLNTTLWFGQQQKIDILQANFKSRWDRIQNMLCETPKRLSYILHRILYMNMDLIFSEGVNFMDMNSVQTYWWEVSTSIQNTLLSPEIQLMTFIKDICSQHRMENTIAESLNGLESSLQMRINRLPTVRHMKTTLSLMTKQNRSKFQFLSLLMKWEEKLNMIKHLLPILKWQLALQSAVNQKYTRQQSNRMDIHQFIHDENSENQDILLKCYEEFAVVIGTLKNTKELQDLSQAMNNVNYECCVSDLVVEDGEHFIMKLMKKILLQQNMFLTEVAQLSIQGCDSLRFMIQDSVVPLSHQYVHYIKLKDLVIFQWDTNLLRFAQNDPQLECGHGILYDLTQIEQNLANRLIVGKPYLNFQEDVFRTVYKNEMFHWCSHIFTDIRKTIPQKEITNDMQNVIIQAKNDTPECMRSALDFLEVIVAMLHNTGGDSQETLLSFAKRWGISYTTIKSKTLIRQLKTYLKLSHIISLYEYIESSLSYLTVQVVANDYKKPLTQSSKHNLDDFMQKRYVAVCAFQTALTRLMSRHLRTIGLTHKTVSPDASLRAIICHPPLWIQDVDLSGMLTSPGHQGKKLEDVFPRSLLVENTHAIHQHLEENMKKQQQPIAMMKKTAQGRRRPKSFFDN